MKLGLVIGKQQGQVIVQRLKGIKDNLDIEVFEGVPDFIDMSLKKNTIYDRILVLSTKITTTTLQDLYNYWSGVSKDMQVVMLSKTGVDEGKAKAFLNTFKTPVASAMLVETTTVQIIAEAVLRPTAELTADYGIKDFLDVTLDEDVAVTEDTPKPEVKHEEPKAEVPVSNPQANNQQKPEKRSLLGSLFGGGKKNKKQQANNQQQNPQQEFNQDLTVPPQYNQNAQNQFEPVQQQNYNQFEQVPQNQFEQIPQQQGYNQFEQVPQNTNIPVQDYNSQNYNMQNSQQNINTQNNNNGYTQESYDYSNQGNQYVQQDNFGYQNTGNEYNTPNYNMSSSTSQQQFNNNYQQNSQGNYQNSNINGANPSLDVDEDFGATFESAPQGGNDFEPEVYNVDEDFSSQDYYVEQSVNTPNTMMGNNVGTVNDSFGNMSVGDAEESYRAANDAPKVVTKTVVKEVIRNVGSGGKLVALEGVYSGRLKKIVIVTGDRGTGVTSTAYNLAQTLAKKVDVLYFDCDIDNHGLLSYIDYANFKNYENNHMNGTKLCRTSQAFDTCVISWDTNLYLLTSDYTCDTTVEELQRTSEIVAERATDFGVVVVDCPIEKLNYIKDLILTGQSITCVEGSKRGFMNMLCQLERSTLPTRFKRTLVARGNLFVTKCSRNLDLKKLVAFIRALFEPADVDWLSQNIVAFDGKLTDKLLNDILEG